MPSLDGLGNRTVWDSRISRRMGARPPPPVLLGARLGVPDSSNPTQRGHVIQVWGDRPPSRATSLVTCSHCSQLFLCYWPLTKGEEIVA